MIASPALVPGADMVEAFIRASRRRRRIRLATRLLILVSFLGAWEILGRVVSPLFLVPLSTTVGAMFDPELFQAWATSLQAFAIGYGLASVTGIAIGLLMGRFQLAEKAINPYLTILLATPMVAMIPVFIIVFGFTLAARAAIVFSFVFVYVAINAHAGSKAVPRELVEMSRSIGLTEWQRFRWIVLRSAGPLILTGLRLGFGRATIGMLLSEMLLLAVGIGGKLIEASTRFETSTVLAIVLMLLIFSWVGGSVIELIDHRVNRWQSRRL